MNPLDGAIAIQNNALANIQYQNAAGQIIPLPEPLMNQVLGIMQQISGSQQTTLENIQARQLAVEEKFDRLSNQLLDYYARPDVTLEQMDRYQLLADRTMTMFRTQQYDFFLQMINAVNEANDAAVKGIKGVLDELIDHQWRWMENQANIYDIMLKRDELHNEIKLQEERQRAEMKRLEEEQAHARKIGEMEASNRIEQQNKETERAYFEAILNKQNEVHIQELAAAAKIMDAHHVNKKIDAVAPYIDWVNKVVVPGKVTCEGIGLPPPAPVIHQTPAYQAPVEKREKRCAIM